MSGSAREVLTPGISADEVARLYGEHSTMILMGVFVGAVTWCGVFLVFAGALSRFLSTMGSAAALSAWIGLAGAILNASVLALFCVLSAMAAFLARDIEAASVFMLHQGALLTNNSSGIPTVVCVIAYTIGGLRAGVFPRWVVGLAVVTAAFHLASAVSLASKGVASPSGPASMLAPFTMTAWVLGVSIALRRPS